MATKKRKIVKKRRKSVKKLSKAARKGLSKPKLTLMDKLPKNEIEYMELLIFFTERAIGTVRPDQTMIAQRDRLQKQLDEMRAKG